MNEVMMAKAKEAKTAAELMELAKAENMELTEEKAQEFFARLHAEGELNDDELDNVSGGGCAETAPKYKVGDIVALVSKRCPDCNGSVFKITYEVKDSTRVCDYWVECNNCRLNNTATESDIAGRIG